MAISQVEALPLQLADDGGGIAKAEVVVYHREEHRIIDEIPILALAACFARGKTIIRNAEELRLKESDRISCTVQELRKLGADVTELTDGMEINGGKYLSGNECISHSDHRISMTLGIAGLISKGKTTIIGSEAADVSYPNFWDSLLSIQA